MTPIEKCDNAPCLVGKLQTLASRDRYIKDVACLECYFEGDVHESACRSSGRTRRHSATVIDLCDDLLHP